MIQTSVDKLFREEGRKIMTHLLNVQKKLIHVEIERRNISTCIRKYFFIIYVQYYDVNNLFKNKLIFIKLKLF